MVPVPSPARRYLPEGSFVLHLFIWYTFADGFRSIRFFKMALKYEAFLGFGKRGRIREKQLIFSQNCIRKN
jgi:hypothetical protein